MANGSGPSLQDLLYAQQYGTHSYPNQALAATLLYAEQYGGQQGQVGIQDRLFAEQYLAQQGQPIEF